ncbi:lipopolysaccharide biosynthesis protein [Xenorhabdus sp. SGI246]|uniref:lipopolysaccharide biosynthesis protein n=1 Tax=Xenorhabdus sp. SGI246 TaxID=3158263 RepID=UPI00349F59FB
MIKKNVIANYIGQFYLAISGIIIVPFYLSRLGSEGYGLIAFFIMLQSWMQLLDMGISTTISREAAISKNSSNNAIFFRKIQRVCFYIFFVISIVVFLSGYFSSNYIIHNWLISNLSYDTLNVSLISIFCIISLRWLCGPWKSTLVGLEKQIPFNIINVFVITLKFPISILILSYFNNLLIVYFIYQIIVAIIEYMLFYIFSRNYTPYNKTKIRIDKEFLYNSIPVFKFSLGIAFISGVWVLITQSDKIILSHILQLDDFGYYSMGVLSASIVMIFSQPIIQAILPRLTVLCTNNKNKESISLYKISTRSVSSIIFPVCILLSVFSEQIIYIWTGDIEISKLVSPILSWYSLGNGLFAISSFSYYIQYAHGDIKLHIIGNVIFLIILMPAIYFSAIYHGSLGVAKVWFYQNLIYLLVWTGIVHRKFLPKEHIKWLLHDISSFIFIPLLILFFYNKIVEILPNSRLVFFLSILLLGISCLIMNILIFKKMNKSLFIHSEMDISPN